MRHNSANPAADMSITVGWNIDVEAGISREEMDAWALRSYQRAIVAIDTGVFDPRTPDGAGRNVRGPAPWGC